MHQSVKRFLQHSLREAIKQAMSYRDAFVQTHEAESLHQYRIHLRLARSVAREFGAFMDEHHKMALMEHLKVLLKKSNTLRDSDVFLASLEAYETLIETGDREEFFTLKEQIEKDKEASLRLFLSKEERTFRQKTMAELLQSIEDETMYLPLADENLMLHTSAILRKRLKKISKRSSKLSLKASNEAFHSLRLEYKKLRYTAEALQLDSFCRSFKPIQTAFGCVQDKNSQIERIKRYNTHHGEASERIVVALEQELIEDKKVCLKKSSSKKLKKLSQKLEKIFTCKKR